MPGAGGRGGGRRERWAGAVINGQSLGLGRWRFGERGNGESCTAVQMHFEAQMYKRYQNSMANIV